ncbi:M20 peptidase aminoacylase family protein [Evansella sp. AB-P1]|uniref:M20 peptidase aminoacylase family protein n=1 Tax=Evansella sp. AB-P1 TaxID=3037653 RepID=UPI00241F7367|nr:M20 peptidase aminoacylase family protein [Evansella sp. AB-P1]MDG5786208.1 M20 peptidase aminoacylase family protein [Evansella sp. AB-P1]
MLNDILRETEPKVLEIFEHLHENPEVSWKEYQTSKYIVELLKEIGLRVTTFPNHTGILAEMGEGSPVVALRADMDALWQEVNGIFQGNHSCGHDAHMAMVIGVAIVLKKLPEFNKGTVRFIFQPAEEKGTGALRMIEEGIVDDVDFLYGVHLRPVQELQDGEATPALYHGAACFIDGKISSSDTHGARPHLGTNAIDVGARIVNMLNGIHLNPMESFSAKMTSFHAGGESANIIPGSATFSLDLRSQKNNVMEQLIRKVTNIIENSQDYFQVSIHLETKAEVAAAEVDNDAKVIVKAAILEAYGEGGKLRPPLVTTGGDDFHFYTIKCPNIKATMLGLGCGLTPGLHHPDMTFNKKELINGVHILTLAIMKTIRQRSSCFYD